MLRDRKDYPRVFTPRGEAIFPAVDQPDYKFKEGGEFHVRLRLNPDDAGLQDLISQAEAIRDEAFDAKKASLEKQKKMALVKELTKVDVVKEEIDQETAEPTGFVILRAALTYRVDIKNGPKAGETFYKTPDIFDATGRTIKVRKDRDGAILGTNVPRVGSGSTVKLNVTIQDYETDGGKTIGARFELNAVQIIKLVQGGQRSASDYGFGVEEDGDVLEDTGGFDDESSSGSFEAEDAGASRDF